MTADVIPVHQGGGESTAAVLEATDVVKVLGAGAGEVRALKGVSLSLAIWNFVWQHMLAFMKSHGPVAGSRRLGNQPALPMF